MPCVLFHLLLTENDIVFIIIADCAVVPAQC